MFIRTAARRSVRAAAGLGLAGLLTLAPSTSHAAIHVVVDGGDTLAPGQLRTLVSAAVDGDIVIVPALTVTLASGGIQLAANITIIGAGHDLTIIDGGGLDRVFDVPATRTVVIAGLTMRRGVVATGVGGGVRNMGTLTLSDVVVEDCEAEAGGGVGTHPGSTTFLQTVTVHRNTTHGLTAIGGGVFNGGTMEIRESAIHDNLAGDPMRVRTAAGSVIRRSCTS